MYAIGCRAHVCSTRSILKTFFSLGNTLFVYYFLFCWFAYTWRYSFTLYHTFIFFAWYLCVVLFIMQFYEHQRNDCRTELLHFCETSTWNQTERGSIILKKNANCIWSFHVRFNLWRTYSGLALGINNSQDKKKLAL